MTKTWLPDDQAQGDESNHLLGIINATMDITEQAGLAAAQKEEERKKRGLAPKKKETSANHGKTKVAFFHYSYYDVAFKFFVEQVLDCEWVAAPPRTKRSMELGARYSNDFVCAPFKHMIGDYIDALECGADVLVQFCGPCRLGYYGELQENILKDLGYEFKMLNFAELSGIKAYVMAAREINPKLSIAHGVNRLVCLAKMVRDLDEVYDYYLAHAGFEVEKGSFKQALNDYHEALREATDAQDIAVAKQTVDERMQAIEIDVPANPIRVGILGEFFTTVDQHSNLDLENKLLDMGVALYRKVNLTHRYIEYDEPALRKTVSEYLRYDAGPTTTLTVATAKEYAVDGFDGLVHLKSSGCTPEIDAIPILQRVSNDYEIPLLCLSFDSQTSDAGLDTRLEAFYDMLAMKKNKEQL